MQLKQCHFLFKQALDADEAELREKALELYTQAVQVALNVVRDMQTLIIIKFKIPELLISVLKSRKKKYLTPIWRIN